MVCGQEVVFGECTQVATVVGAVLVGIHVQPYCLLKAGR